MKKALSAVLAVVLVLGVCFSVPMIASANDTDPSDFDYRLTDDGYVITGFNGTVGADDGIVTIPATYTLGEGETIANGGIVVRPVVSSVDDPVNSDAVEGSVEHVTVTAVTNGDVKVSEADGKVTLEVTPKENYVIDAVTVVDGDDATVTTEVSDDTYTFSKETGKTYTVTVTFKLATYTVTINAGEKGGVTATVNEAPVTSGSTVNAGSNVVLTITPDKGYQIDSFKENGVPKTVSGNTYTIENVSADVTIDATFKEIPDEKYTITANVTGAVFTVANEAEEGEPVEFTVVAAKGYQLGKGTTITYTLAGEEKTESLTAAEDGSYSFTMPAANVKITVTSKLIKYPVTAQKDANGAVYFDKTENVTYTVGETVKVYVKPAKPFACAGVEVTYGTDGKITATKGETAENVTEYTFQIPEIDGKAEFLVVADINPTALDVVGIEEGVFADTTGIKEFKLATDQNNFTVEGGVLFDGTTLLAYPDASTVESYTLPANVTAIAEGAFAKCTTLKYVFTALGSTFTANNIGVNNCPITAPGVLHIGMQEHGKVEDESKRVNATCVTAGTKYYKCTLEGCDYVHATTAEDTIPADGTTHNMSDWDVVTAATCTQEGVKRKVCTNKDANGNSCDYYVADIITKPDHEKSDKGVITTPAKCGVKGEETFYCKTCDYVLETKEVAALEHEITDNKGNENIIAKKDATCKDAGFVKGNCDHCGNVVTIDYEKLTHKYVDVVDAEVTCTVNGWQHKECEYCGDYKDGSDMELTAPGHIAATVKNGDKVELKWTVVKAPTCSEDGFAEVRCENCGIQMVDPEGKIEYTRVLPATGKHDFKDYTVTKAATCEDEGEKTGTCACGATDVQKIDALDHEWAKEYTVDIAATCTKKGSESIKCTVCGDKDETRVRDTALAPHTADASWTTVTGKEATCYAEGEKTGTCTVCKTANCLLPIEKLEHRWATEAVNLKADIVGTIQATETDGTPKVDATTGEPVMVPYTYKAPTCEVEGYKAIYCTNKDCPTSIIKEGSLVKVDALGHDYDDAYNIDIPTNKSATCKEAGYMFKWCKTCSEANKTNENKGYVKIELPKKDHEWKTAAENLRTPITIQVEKVVDGKVELGKDGKPVMVGKQVSAPTCEKTGYTAIYCENYATCGEIKDVTEVAARGHLYDEAKWVKVSDATCMAKEIQSNTCLRTDCDDLDRTQTREYGDFAAHNYSTTKTTVYPTCEKDGVEYYACTTTLDGKQCESRSQEKAIDALGHKFAEGAKFNVITEVGCEVNGEKVMECLNSFHKVTKEPYKETTNSGTAGDSNASGNGGTTPVAEGDGTEGGTTTTTRPAAPDGYEYCAGYKVITPATGHAFSDDYTKDLDATCEVPGKESRHCTNEDCTEKTGSRDIPALGHNYSTEYKTVEGKAATCKDEGREARYCLNKDCKSYTGERRLAKTSHSYDEANGWVVDTRATCTTKGSKHVDCKVCGAAGRKTAEIAALGHDISNATLQTKAATCLADGETYKLCERIVATTGENGAVTYAPCNEKVVIEELKATGHNVENWDTETDPATCTKAGTKTGTCTNERCPNTGKQVTETVPALGHQYSTEPTRTEPTCYKEGKLVGTCTRPGCTAETGKAEQILPMIDHTWGDWEMNIDPATEKAYDDCTKTGSLIRKCTVKACGAFDEPTENKKHTESGWILDSEANCGVNGKMHTECTVCKKVTAEQKIYATGEHDYEEVIIKEPTCNTPGSKTVKCKVKGCPEATEKTVSIDPVDHTFTEWKVFVEPTCTEKGIRQSVCTVCLTTKSEKILALGHDLGKDVITAPTCTVAGSKHQECSRCDYKTTATPIAALGHNYTTSNTCSAKDCGAQLYEYKLIGESTTDIEIVKYNPDAKNVVENVVIPSEIDGYIVKAIGDRAFMNVVVVKGAEATESTPAGQDTTKCEKSQFTTVTIPETVTTIGDYAFATASDKFKSVVIPGTVTTIGDYAFGYNVELNWIPDAEAEVEVGETRPLIESTPLLKSRVEDFAIYGVKDSAAAVYAAQNPEVDTDDFKFAAIADIYEVAIPEEFTEVVEKADDKVVLFKEFVEYAADATNKKSIAEQIAAVVDINVSGYSVEVVSSQSYDVMKEDAEGNVTEEVKETLYFYGTGTKVLVKEGSNVVDVIEIVVQGDVNGDGAVDAIDCMLVQLASQNQKALDGVYLTAGDYNYDGKVEVADFSGVVNRVFGTDVIIGEEETTTPSTSAPTTTEPTTEAPAESTTQAPAESTTQAPVESTTQAPAESTTQAPAESTTQAPAESTTQTPAESTTQTSGEAA